MHTSKIATLLFCGMSWFDQNPCGNRFLSLRRRFFSPRGVLYPSPVNAAIRCQDAPEVAEILNDFEHLSRPVLQSDVHGTSRQRGPSEPSPLREPSGFFHRAENLDDPIDTRTERCSEAGHHLLKGIVATPQGLDACYC